VPKRALAQTAESGCCCSEAAGIAVERFQARLVVHVEPLAPLRSCSVSRCSDYSPTQTAALVTWMHDRVKEEAVYTSVRDNVNERDQLTTEERAGPGHSRPGRGPDHQDVCVSRRHPPADARGRWRVPYGPPVGCGSSPAGRASTGLTPSDWPLLREAVREALANGADDPQRDRGGGDRPAQVPASRLLSTPNCCTPLSTLPTPGQALAEFYRRLLGLQYRSSVWNGRRGPRMTSRCRCTSTSRFRVSTSCSGSGLSPSERSCC